MAEQEKEILKDAETSQAEGKETAGADTQTAAEETMAAENAENQTDSGAESDEETSEENKGGKKVDVKVFGKKKKEKEDPLKQRVEELEDRVKRQMAEFENFRKRSEKEKSAMYDVGAKSVIEKILPVVDNFERGLAAIPEEEKGSAFADGMNMIYKQLIGELDKLDVKPIEAVGTEFNPELHNAVMQVESEEYESGVVAQELQKGYTYHDIVVRHSMVAVVQ